MAAQNRLPALDETAYSTFMIASEADLFTGVASKERVLAAFGVSRSGVK